MGDACSLSSSQAIAQTRDELLDLARELEADPFENWDSVAYKLRLLASRFAPTRTRSVAGELDSETASPQKVQP